MISKDEELRLHNLLASAEIKISAQRMQIDYLNELSENAIVQMDKSGKVIEELRIANSRYQNQMDGYADEVIALKSIVDNLRKQKVYQGQKFYDPNNQRLPTVYLCARWNDWYMIRQSNQLTPQLLSAAEWQIQYGHYVVMPRMNANLKNLS